MTKETLGTILIIFGVAAWGVYYGVEVLTDVDLPFPLFLAWHLSGVISGAYLRGGSKLGALYRAARRSLTRQPGGDEESL